MTITICTHHWCDGHSISISRVWEKSQGFKSLGGSFKYIYTSIWLEGCKSKRIKNGGNIEKMSLHKFTHIPLLKNDTQLKKKK